MLYNSPRNDQPSAKTSQTSLTDLSLAIGTAYESIHTFVFSHEKSLIRIFVILLLLLLPQGSVKPLIFYTKLIYDGQRCASTPSDRSCSHPTSRVKISGLCVYHFDSIAKSSSLCNSNITQKRLKRTLQNYISLILWAYYVSSMYVCIYVP